MLKIIGKNIHLDLGEMEMLKYLMHGAELTEQEALEEVINYKREQALLHEGLGNWRLAKQILQQIDEWDGSRDQEFEENIEKELQSKQDIQIIT